MKIARYKKAQRTINFYKNNFAFREPYQILIDATFCQLALQHKINIQEQLPKYLQSELRLVTTQCIIMEAESLGPQIQGATQIVKQFLVHKCGHDKSPISGSACLKAMCKANRYIIASQDRDLQEWLRSRPGQPMLYLHQKTPVLEQPSDASRKFSAKVIDKSQKKDVDADKLKTIKISEGLLAVGQDEQIAVKKKFKKKQPNPLSCKKKKKTVAPRPAVENIKSKTIEKKSRTRIKLPKHVKEHLANLKNKNS